MPAYNAAKTMRETYNYRPRDIVNYFGHFLDD